MCVPPSPPRRARRRVETPPGAQAQADWAEFPGVWVGGVCEDLLAFHLQLSFFDAVVWSQRKHELAWLWVHNETLRRLGGVPAVIRVDNEKTAISRGAGARKVRHACASVHSRPTCVARSLPFEGARPWRALYSRACSSSRYRGSVCRRVRKFTRLLVKGVSNQANRSLPT